MNLRSLALVLFILPAVFGCQATHQGCGCPEPCVGQKLDYWSARGLDALDMVELNVGFGQGLHAAAEIAPLRIGYGFSDVHRTGTMNRAVGTWAESRKEFWLLRDVLVWQKEPCCGNGYLFDTCHIPVRNALDEELDFSPLAWPDDEGWTTRMDDHEKNWGDFGVEATLGFLAVDAFVSPREVLDFALGIFTLDGVSYDDFGSAPCERHP